MATIQPPPPPTKTGNAQVDNYLQQLYRWAYTFWFYQSGNGTESSSDSGSGLQIPGLDGEPGEDGQMGMTGPMGPRGLPGLTIPGMDGQDADDYAMFSAPGSGAYATLTQGAKADTAAQATNNLGFFAATTSAQLAGVLSDEVGSGFSVFRSADTAWTPIDSSGAGLSLTVYGARYVDMGDVIFASADLAYPITADASAVVIGGLPATVKNDGGWRGGLIISNTSCATLRGGMLTNNATTFDLRDNADTGLANSAMSGKRLGVMCIYLKA